MTITSNGYVLDQSPQRMGRLEPVPDCERSDKERLWKRLRRDGYLYLKGQLDPETVTNFRAYYFQQLMKSGLVTTSDSTKSGIDAGGLIDRLTMREILTGEIVPGVRFDSVTSHPGIRGWFEWFLGEDVHLHKRKIIRHIRPGEEGIGTATQAHYDLVYLREGTDRVLSTWIPLGDCPIEMGGLTYLEHSHHRVMRDEREGRLLRPQSITADLPSLAEKWESRWLLANYEAGDVMVHSAHIVHASTDNVDPHRRIRLSTDFRYQRRSEPIDWRWQQHWRDDDGL